MKRKPNPGGSQSARLLGRWPHHKGIGIDVGNCVPTDDIATHLFLDPRLIRRRQTRLANWDFFDSPEWRRPVAKFLAEIRKQSVELSAKQGLVLAAGAAFVVASIWLGSYWLIKGRFIESTDDAYVGGDVTTLSFKVSGFIQTVAIVDNQSVKAGDLLLKLDDRDYRAQLARVEASVAAQRAALANLDASRHLQQAVIEQASADIAAAAAELARTKYDVDRYRTLSNDRFASLQRFEQADADHEKARAAERRARAVLDAAERRLDVIDTEKQQAEAALDQVLADRDLALLNLSYTQIRAPIDGTVANRSARTGAFATVGAQVLAIIPAHGLWVDANFKESQLASIREGQAAEVFADVLPGLRFRGRVASVAPATGAQFSIIPAENATGNFTKIVQRVPVRIIVEDDAAELGKLRPGLSVVTYIDTRSVTAAREARR